jgi:hypothetical protein
MLILIAADIWAIYNIAKSEDENLIKLLWVVLVIGMPLFGVIIWYLLGRKEGEEAALASAAA